MNDQVEDALISELYPSFDYPTIPPQQVASEPQRPKRRRRRKNKGDEGNSCTLKKRKLTPEQVNMLEMSFGCEHKLESKRKDRLASELGLDPRQVAVWFQNRRSRWKCKKLEDEYSILRKEKETLLIDKCHLQNEVISLKDELREAKREIQRLLDQKSSSSTTNNVSSNNPSSALTADYNQVTTNDEIVMDADQLLITGGQFDSGPNCFDNYILYGNEYLHWTELPVNYIYDM